jgi:hypothetical protein
VAFSSSWQAWAVWRYFSPRLSLARPSPIFPAFQRIDEALSLFLCFLSSIQLVPHSALPWACFGYQVLFVCVFFGRAGSAAVQRYLILLDSIHFNLFYLLRIYFYLLEEYGNIFARVINSRPDVHLSKRKGGRN